MPKELDMLRNLRIAVIGLTALVGACVHAEDPRASAAGSCLTAEIGEWTPPTELSPQQQPPARFQLLEETGEGMLGHGQTIVRPVIEGYGSPTAFWTMPTPDSLVVTWTNGYEGMRLRLTRAGDMWTGTANPMTDVWIEGQSVVRTAPVTVEPVACR